MTDGPFVRNLQMEYVDLYLIHHPVSMEPPDEAQEGEGPVVVEKKGLAALDMKGVWVQVCIRWVYEQGDCMIVKSFNQSRMQENLDIFDWELTMTAARLASFQSPGATTISWSMNLGHTKH
ncbi:unnamed protein product [Miscanthus lutarioriparius]|uniref:NADP-dependent oxidoreductase domain-containing protein n=1 Tax=Miscanthus lutarioriparius TaxID=422564 RepID=A0A811MDP9_9POAL|nr:unnamed protein product [Miscanthus lutarioriparius]